MILHENGAHLEKKIAFLLQLWLCDHFKVLRIGQNDFFYKIKWSEKLILALEPRNKKKVRITLKSQQALGQLF